MCISASVYLPEKHCFTSCAGGQGAGALGREGALAVQCVLGVHHAALHVGADGNAAAHVADDEVQLLILLALLLGEALGHGLLVQGVENADTLEQGMTGIARHIGHLIDDHGVHDVGGDAQLVADLAGDQAAQVGGVLTLNADGAVRDHVVVDGVGAAADGTQQTAAAADGGQGAGVEALLAQRAASTRSRRQSFWAAMVLNWAMSSALWRRVLSKSSCSSS